MKANSLWVGHDYAYIQWRGRGQIYSYEVERVKVNKLYKRRIPGNRNDTAFAEVYKLDLEGNKKNEETYEIRARDIVDFWDDWWNDIEFGDDTNGERLLKHKKYVEEEEKRRQEERDRYRKQQEEREALEAQRRAELQMKRNLIRQKLESVGLTPTETYPYTVSISQDGTVVTIKEPELSKWIAVEGVKTIDI